MRALGILFLVMSSLIAASVSAQSSANPAPEAEIKALETRLADLIVHAAWDEYASHLAPEYLHTRDNGRVENKDEALAALRDEKRKIIVMEMEHADATVRLYGDSAIANAEFALSVRDNGQVKNRRVRLTQVFVKREGAWLLVLEHATTIGR